MGRIGTVFRILYVINCQIYNINFFNFYYIAFYVHGAQLLIYAIYFFNMHNTIIYLTKTTCSYSPQSWGEFNILFFI